MKEVSHAENISEISAVVVQQLVRLLIPSKQSHSLQSHIYRNKLCFLIDSRSDRNKARDLWWFPNPQSETPACLHLLVTSSQALERTCWSPVTAGFRFPSGNDSHVLAVLGSSGIWRECCKDSSPLAAVKPRLQSCLGRSSAIFHRECFVVYFGPLTHHIASVWNVSCRCLEGSTSLCSSKTGDSEWGWMWSSQ